MGFVDGKCGKEAARMELLEDGGEGRGGESLGGNIQELDMRLGERSEVSKDLINGGGVLGRAKVACFDPSGAQGGDLVLHQRDKGANYDGDTVGKEGRELVAEGFPPARGEKDQTGAAVEDVGDDFLLHFPEFVQAERGPQLLEHPRLHNRRCAPGCRRCRWYDRLCHLCDSAKGLCRGEEAR